ncbi:tRNA uridine-5-carboxymethylaminomethyl(34) synthesis GTPase MnmE [Aureitalea sp. L0-47]|uniref:tRNA uridine-5-carboxymethylaminomethyl(34) synthesis GTPase MnmE n=1 Tax=Aureitalea sp. L0-47 TaxID=2816962 RepID=UPI002238951B|nr:tRNA uridine-5-carboxymethylaminomethyl(34) synthesis GTPase MnmE [Aureitalea sp. L0-47]MCW5520378.1 tRNA uridine-5-carboxymethylaminomethyl(34) synthesis GTPase MnmE [Aureitalea sp. L0-47]
MTNNDTIVALATPAGAGAIAVIRISGPEALTIGSSMFQSVSGKVLGEQPSHTVHLGHVKEDQRIIDEVLATVFKDPHSYTGEDVIEFSCHGSSYIQQEIIQYALRKGCRMAQPGEFTLRAFLHGKMDLSQAEAVADLISSDSEASHQLAIQQMRGGFSSEIKQLREQLLNFASLIELELDFAEEDVEFANRDDFQKLISRIRNVLKRLIDSFATGNVLKNGIPVAIVGEPNVGKSTLLNALLNEERAIVSDIAGTTRDTIEDEITIGGIGFRFIDTAGIRDTSDVIEGLGIQKTYEKMEQAQVVVFLLEASNFINQEDALKVEIRKIHEKYPQKAILVIANKADLISEGEKVKIQNELNVISGESEKSRALLLTAKTGEGVEELKNSLLDFVNTGALRNNETIVTNSRHYDALIKALEEIDKVQQGIDNKLSGDLLAIDIRQALYHFGEITGEISNDELLGNIFANFCIGK